MLPPEDFPLHTPEFAHEFGVRALPAGQGPWRRTGDFDAELRLKKRVLRLRPDDAFAATPDSRPLCEEVARWIAEDVKAGVTGADTWPVDARGRVQ